MLKRLLCLGFTIAICSLTLTACGKKASDFNNTGIKYYGEGEFSKAEEAFYEASVKDGKKSEYFVNLGMARLELKEFDEARDAFSQALAIDGTSRQAKRGLGMCYYYCGDYSDAIDTLCSLIRESGENYDDITLESLQYYAALQTYYADYAGALDSYTILIKKNYNKAQQCFLRGSIYASQGMENEAVQDYEVALKEYGDNYEMYYNIYYDLYKAGLTDRAYSYLKRALELKGTDDLVRGKTYYILGEYENARKYLSKAVDAGKTEAEFYLAMAYDMMGSPEEAKDLYERYIEDYPQDARAYNQYGMYYLSKGDYATALTLFEKGLAIEGDEGRRELLFNQACCYEYLEDYKKAYELFGEYLALYPGDSAAKHEYDFLSTR